MVKIKIQNIVFYILLASIVLLVLGLLLVVTTTNYTNFISILHTACNNSVSKDIIETKYMPLHKFHTLIYYCKVIVVLMSLLCVIMCKYHKKCKENIASIITTVKQYTLSFFTTLSSIDKKYKRYLLILLLAVFVRSIYYSCTWYIQHDEAWNYNTFLNKNIGFTFLVYNNYPLHNIISWVMVHILPVSTFVLRLPSIVFGVLATYTVFVVFYKLHCNAKLSIFIASLFACLPVSVFYMLYARGVMMEIFFAFLLYYVLIKLGKKEISNSMLWMLMLLQTLGVWSMLTHIIYTGACCLFLLVIQKNKPRIFLYTICSLLFCSLLFICFYLGTGLSVAIKTGASGYNLLSDNFNIPWHAYSSFFTGFEFLLYSFLGINIFFVYKYYYTDTLKYTMAVFNIILLAGMFVLPMLIKTYLPERALAFLVVVPVSTFYLVLLLFPKKEWMYVPLLLLFSYKAHTHNFIQWSKDFDSIIYKFSKTIEEKNICCIYNTNNSFGYYIPILEYYAHLQHRTITIHTNAINTNRYMPEQENSCTTLVLKNTATWNASAYQEIFLLEDVRIIQKKDFN